MRIRPLDLVDILAYLVVLGVFIQLFPDVIAESFLLSLLTAILLKLVLEGVLWLKTAVIGRIRASRRRDARIVHVIALALILPGSKFLVLELVALIFGDSVQLGDFFQVTALIIVLTITRGALRCLLVRRSRAEVNTTTASQGSSANRW